LIGTLVQTSLSCSKERASGQVGN